MNYIYLGIYFKHAKHPSEIMHTQYETKSPSQTQQAKQDLLISANCRSYFMTENTDSITLLKKVETSEANSNKEDVTEIAAFVGGDFFLVLTSLDSHANYF